ncbi:MAG: M23 family metallopeptidase [Geitlerinemataceae cyanobacterium]
MNATNPFRGLLSRLRDRRALPVLFALAFATACATTPPNEADRATETAETPEIAVAQASATDANTDRPIELGLPIDCDLGEDCFVLLYPDVDPSDGIRDSGCGGQTYDTHKGTDFAVASVAELDRGVNALAVADGTVLRLRDGVPDRRLRTAAEIDEIAAQGIECGNGIVIDHGDGWEGQYCHLKQGSVAVASGDRVRRGEPIGQIGVSGKTTFPHVHLTLSRNGEVIDPASGQPTANGCNQAGQSLWLDPEAQTYKQTGIISLGFADRPPTVDDLWDGVFDAPQIDTDAEVLLFWAHYYGVEAGDIEHYRLTDGAGNLITDYEQTIEANSINGLGYVGKRNTPNRPIVPGTWRGEYSLTRDGETIASKRIEFEVRPAR